MTDTTDTHDEVASALRELVEQFGPQRMTNRESVAAMLTDRLGPAGPAARKEVRLVAAAAGEGVVGELQSGDPVSAVASRFAASTGFSDDAAAWAVTVWARALGSPVEQPGDRPTEPVPQPESGSDPTVPDPEATRRYPQRVPVPDAPPHRDPSSAAGRPRLPDAPPRTPDPPTEPAGTPRQHGAGLDDQWAQGTKALRKRRQQIIDWYAANVSNRPVEAVLAYTQSNILFQAVALAAGAGLIVGLATGTPVVVPSGLVLVIAWFATRRQAMVLTDHELTLVGLTLTGKPKEVTASWPRPSISAAIREGVLLDRIRIVPAGTAERSVYVHRRERPHARALTERLPSPEAMGSNTAGFVAAGVFGAVVLAQLAAGAALATDEERSTGPTSEETDEADEAADTADTTIPETQDSEPETETTPDRPPVGDDEYGTDHLNAKVPSGWDVSENPSQESITLSSADGQRNVIFSVESVEDGTATVDYADDQTAVMRQEFPEFQQDAFEYATVFNERDGVRRVFSWVPEGSGQRVYQEQHYWTSGSQGFTATATATTPSDLDRLRAVLAGLSAYPDDEN